MDVPPGQAKCVPCVAGAVMDVVVDLRVGSPSLGVWKAVRLNERDREASSCPGPGPRVHGPHRPGTVLSLCSVPYDPAHEHGMDSLDPDLGIPWPLHESGPRMSVQDIVHHTLAESVGKGLLPSCGGCLNYQEELRNQHLSCA